MIFEALGNNIFPVQNPGVGYIQNFVTVKSYIFLTVISFYISIHILVGFVVNKGFYLQLPAERLEVTL